MLRRCAVPVAVYFLCAGALPTARGHDGARQTPADKRLLSKQNSAKPLSPAEELQKAIADAGNDRAALVRNLKAYLEKYPDAPERPRIYRALVEACMQFKDDACAAEYAERIVALTPDDTSMTLLAVQLLERHGDAAALRRAVTYITRLYESVKNAPASEKSPRLSLEEWEGEKKRDQAALLAVRGRLLERLNDTVMARKDFEASYALQPNEGAAWTSWQRTMKPRLRNTPAPLRSRTPRQSPTAGGRSAKSSETPGGWRTEAKRAWGISC